MISSELWAATDYVLQVITANYVPFGGKLFIATGDFFQLPPPSGFLFDEFFFSLTTFTFLKLENFVRMQTKMAKNCCLCCQRLQKLTAMRGVSGKLIGKGCNFVHSWKDVPNDRIRIFATRQDQNVKQLKTK